MPVKWRQCSFVVAVVVILLAMAEGCSYVLIYLASPLLDQPILRTGDIFAEQSERIRILLEGRNDGREMFDSELGWRYRPGYRSEADHINRMGLRSAREYVQAVPADGTVRVAAFGDSFVYGTEVATSESWAARVEESFPRIEVLNYGVGGYGVDQALLRFRREGKDLAPDIVLIGFAPVDLSRIVNVYRRFLSNREGLATKPRFLLDGAGELTLVPNPIQSIDDWRAVLADPRSVRAWGELDQWYEPLIYENALYDLSALVRIATTTWIRLHNRYLDADRLLAGGLFNTSSAAFKIQMAVFRTFADEARAIGATPIVLILPDRESIERVLDERQPQFAPLLEHLRMAGIEYLDATEALARVPAGEELSARFAPGGHYSPLGNSIVAEWLGPLLLQAADGGGASPGGSGPSTAPAAF